MKTFTFTNVQNNRSLVKSLGMDGARLPEWVDDNNETEEKMEEGMEDQEVEKMMEGWFGGEKKRWKGENCFREEGEGDVREILALAEAQELQAKLVSANQLVEQLKEEVKRLKEEQENNMAELISEHRQDLEEERLGRERERLEFEGRLERLAVGGGREAELKRQLVKREAAVGELRKQGIKDNHTMSH